MKSTRTVTFVVLLALVSASSFLSACRKGQEGPSALIKQGGPSSQAKTEGYGGGVGGHGGGGEGGEGGTGGHGGHGR